MNRTAQINPERLAVVQSMTLDTGKHDSLSKGACVMELISYVAGEPWSDRPKCACPVISTFLRNWNDALPDDERTDLLRDLIPLLVGTRSTREVEQRRGVMAADWLIRTHTSAWLRLAGLTTQADTLESLPEITDFAQCQSLMPTLIAARAAADAAADAAPDAAYAAADAAYAAADAAYAAPDAAAYTAYAAARAAAYAAYAAARDAAYAAYAAYAAADAAYAAARAAAYAAYAAARAAARAAADAALKTTGSELKLSAKALVIRMCEVRA